MSAHLHRSTKGWNKLKDIMVSMKMKVSKPPRAVKTRWGYIIPILQWVGVNKAALRKYNSLAPKDCASNDDGTTFKDHQMSDDEMAIAYQLVATLLP
jgi:hypothetical protein